MFNIFLHFIKNLNVEDMDGYHDGVTSGSIMDEITNSDPRLPLQSFND